MSVEQSLLNSGNHLPNLGMRYRRHAVKALRYQDGLSLVDLPPPECGPTDALIAVRIAGVCATDLEVLRGYRAFHGVLGHEMVGHVVACRADPTWVGKRVAPEINVGCGDCAVCRRGQPGHCRVRRVLGIAGRDGCFAEFVALPVANLHAIPDTVDDLTAAFTEPLAAAYAIVSQVDLRAHPGVAVLGDGKLGLLVAMALAERGAAVTLLGRHERKLALAAAVGIATLPSNAAPPDSFDLVVEATGSPEGLGQALALVVPRGTLVLKSTFVGMPTVDTNRIVVDEITVVGSRCGPFDVALAALASGAVDPRPLVDARYPLADGLEALEHARRKGALKILLEV